MRIYLKAMLIGLALGCLVATVIYAANEQMQPPTMRVLSTHEALERGWSPRFEE